MVGNVKSSTATLEMWWTNGQQCKLIRRLLIDCRQINRTAWHRFIITCRDVVPSQTNRSVIERNDRCSQQYSLRITVCSCGIAEVFHYDMKHVRKVGHAAACFSRYRTLRSISRSQRSRLRELFHFSSPLISSPLHPLFAVFSFLHFILRLSWECIADASRLEIFIGTRACSYVGNLNHKRRLREILIDSRGQLSNSLPVRAVKRRRNVSWTLFHTKKQESLSGTRQMQR